MKTEPLSDQRKELFLSELSKHGIVSRAAEAASPHLANPSSATAFFYAQRKKDPQFAAAWEAAKQDALSRIEHEIYRRGQVGYQKPVYQKGELVGHITEFSDALLTMRAKALMPKYQDRSHTTNQNLNVNVDLALIAQMTPESRQLLRQILQLEGMSEEKALLLETRAVKVAEIEKEDVEEINGTVEM